MFLRTLSEFCLCKTSPIFSFERLIPIGGQLEDNGRSPIQCPKSSAAYELVYPSVGGCRQLQSAVVFRCMVL